MDWLEFRAQVAPELVEPVVELFQRYVKQAPAIEEAGGFNPDQGETPDPDAPVTVRTFLLLNRRAQGRRARIEAGYQLLSLIHPMPPLEVRQVQAKEWEEASREFTRLLRVGRRLVLRPPDQEYLPREGDVVLFLEPGLGFGTGHHPTTRMCLEEIERRVTPGMRVLDLGTGSGVLSLAAARLGATQVVAVDRDLQALRAARRNVRANGLTRKIRVLRGDAPAEGERFDLIVANISPRVLTELASRLLESLVPGGTLVASGVLEEQGPEVTQRFVAAGLRVQEVRCEEEWLAIVAVH